MVAVNLLFGLENPTHYPETNAFCLYTIILGWGGMQSSNVILATSVVLPGILDSARDMTNEK